LLAVNQVARFIEVRIGNPGQRHLIDMSGKDRHFLRALLREAVNPVNDLKRWARLRTAGLWRRQLTGTVFIGITGSHGKTTATQLLSQLLATAGPTHAGVVHNMPKVIAQGILAARRSRHRFFVQEVSGHQPGATEQSVAALRPNVGVVTAIGGDHRKAFGGSWEATAAEKAKLVHCLPADGLAVLNADDPLVAAMAHGCRCRVVTYGRADGADLRLLQATSAWPDRLTMEVAYRGERFAVRSRLVGVHWTLSIQAALLAALELGASRPACLDVLASFEPRFNRMSVHPAPRGAWYILDAGKASFSGIEACLGFLEEASAPRKTVVVGLISDYPGKSRSHYGQVARMALARADRVFFTGVHAARVRRLATGEFAGRLFLDEQPERVFARLSGDAMDGEIIYIKASDATGLRRLFGPEHQPD